VLMSVFKKLFGDGQSDEPPEFTALLELSMQNLEFLMAHHQSMWCIDRAPRWDLSQGVGELVFTFPDGIVKTPAQIIGAIDTSTSMWWWAWGNPSVAKHLQRDALHVLEYGKRHGIERLTTAQWKADEIDGWYMAALATHLCSKNGAYRGPAGTMHVFMTFGPVEGSLRNGQLKIELLPPSVFPEPDFSDVTSKDAVLKLASEGKLFKMLICPAVLGGADIPQNVVYVPPGTLGIQDQITCMIIQVVQKGLNIEFSGNCEYKGDSSIPAKIHYEASHPETNWHFEKTIEVW
jgi:uncharacterized protein DUF6882